MVILTSLRSPAGQPRPRLRAKPHDLFGGMAYMLAA